HKAIDRIMSLSPQKLFLTHYSQVVDLPRLADDMHRRIDDFVALARQAEKATNRTEKIHRSMYAYFHEALAEHGFSGTPEQIDKIVEIDVLLNTMGLEFWLDHQH
ncbi:MAG: MBL fold metallo-hydrolase, partial [Woeseiaceae bacterium]